MGFRPSNGKFFDKELNSELSQSLHVNDKKGIRIHFSEVARKYKQDLVVGSLNIGNNYVGESIPSDSTACADVGGPISDLSIRSCGEASKSRVGVNVHSEKKTVFYCKSNSLFFS